MESYFYWQNEMKELQKNYYSWEDNMKFKNKIRAENHGKRKN